MIGLDYLYAAKFYTGGRDVSPLFAPAGNPRRMRQSITSMGDELQQTGSRPGVRDIYVARQSIYDARLNVVGYEVLYRSGRDNRAVVTDGNQATSELLLNAVVEIGLERVVGEKLAFVNLTREFLLGHHPLPLSNRQLVLEVLEDVTIDAELVQAVARLVAQGYSLALDDAVFREELKPLLSLATIVKVELPAIPAAELAEHVRRFRDYPVKLLAEKIETREEFTRCRALGFEYFQGYFLARPQLIPGQRRAASDVAVLQILGRLSDPDVSVDELERIIRNDATLSYKLLRYVNSAHFSRQTKIESLRQVILLLGVQGIRTMAMLASLSGSVQKAGDLMKDAAQRAVMCERLARLQKLPEASACFTAGLISSLDAVFDLPLEQILASMSLSEALRAAVLRHEGRIGAVLRCAVAVERADWSAIGCGDLGADDIRGAYLAAIEEVAELWAAV
jgi:EAL and modified HD-GYP domain-containing signal transduction protein